MWISLLLFWLGGGLGTLGAIVGQHLSDQSTWPRPEEAALMAVMAVMWFIAIPYTLWSDRPKSK